MTALLLQLLAGLTHAMILFLIASGLSLIFGVTRTINFAHGSLYMLAAYLTVTLGTVLPFGSLSPYAACCSRRSAWRSSAGSWRSDSCAGCIGRRSCTSCSSPSRWC